MCKNRQNYSFVYFACWVFIQETGRYAILNPKAVQVMAVGLVRVMSVAEIIGLAEAEEVIM
jgi:hypothetical protein